MILNDPYRTWTSSNFDLVQTLTAQSWKSFLDLLSDVQSVPVQSMNPELEMTVAGMAEYFAEEKKKINEKLRKLYIFLTIFCKMFILG